MRKLFAIFGVVFLLAVSGVPAAFGEEITAPATPASPASPDFMLMLYSLVYIVEAYILFWLAKVGYTNIFRKVNLNEELFTRDNQAVAISTVGYFMGILIALGGAVSGESQGLEKDVVIIGLYGLISIVFMLLASFVADKLLLPKFNNTKEIIEDRNIGVGFVEAGIYIANGLIILSSSQGDVLKSASANTEVDPLVESVIVLAVFWVLAQIVMVIAGIFYEKMTVHNIHEEMEKDNGAVGLAFAGALIGIGNICGGAVRGDFTGWSSGLKDFGVNVLFGFVMLFIIHKLTDYILAPKVKLSDEQTQETPNIGAGLLEAFGYIGGSFLIVWSM